MICVHNSRSTEIEKEKEGGTAYGLFGKSLLVFLKNIRLKNPVTYLWVNPDEEEKKKKENPLKSTTISNYHHFL